MKKYSPRSKKIIFFNASIICNYKIWSSLLLFGLFFGMVLDAITVNRLKSDRLLVINFSQKGKFNLYQKKVPVLS
jgi:hypothetical protein